MMFPGFQKNINITCKKIGSTTNKNLVGNEAAKASSASKSKQTTNGNFLFFFF